VVATVSFNKYYIFDKMVTYPGSEKARFQQFLFPGVKGRLEVLHFHTSSSCEQKLHDVALSYQLIEL
jgi:hypothetical protein